ncbi:MAG: hypothetical protein D6801_00670 [Alphaproteobacteria bacterium]|nr:MAG: hypothetical protein D6801_00670 [Alphaproteobacteria bacterium]
MWPSRANLVFGALVVLALSGCMEFPGAGAAARLPKAEPTLTVWGGAFVIAGPHGFCIDPGAARQDEKSAFAVLGSCATISGNPRDAKPRKPAVLTALVAPAAAPLDDAALDRLSAFFRSPDGEAALARSDHARHAEVIGERRVDGALVLHARDGDSSGNVSGDYWRAVLDVSGNLVTLTVSGYSTDPLDETSGARLTERFIAAVRAANRDAGAPPEAAGGGLAALFNRLPL